MSLNAPLNCIQCQSHKFSSGLLKPTSFYQCLLNLVQSVIILPEWAAGFVPEQCLCLVLINTKLNYMKPHNYIITAHVEWRAHDCSVLFFVFFWSTYSKILFIVLRRQLLIPQNPCLDLHTLDLLWLLVFSLAHLVTASQKE